MSSQYLFVSITDTYRRRHEMWQAQELEVTTLKRNFCYYVRKTGEQMQVPKKLVMRRSQKMSGSVQVLDLLFNAVFWCEHHRPSQLCQQQPPAMGLLCTIHISPGKPELLGNVYLWDLLPVAGLVPFSPSTAFLASKPCALVFLPVFSFFKSLFFTSHS